MLLEPCVGQLSVDLCMDCVLFSNNHHPQKGKFAFHFDFNSEDTGRWALSRAWCKVSAMAVPGTMVNVSSTKLLLKSEIFLNSAYPFFIHLISFHVDF